MCITREEKVHSERSLVRSHVCLGAGGETVLGFSSSLVCQYTIFGLPFEDAMVEVRCFYHKNELDYAAGCMQVSNAFSYRFRLQVQSWPV